MREMLSLTRALEGMGLDNSVALGTEGRFFGVSRGASTGHISLEAASGGTIALVAEGDMISIDTPNNKLELLVDDAMLAKRREGWKPVEKAVSQNIYLKRYRRMVTAANTGAVFVGE